MLTADMQEATAIATATNFLVKALRLFFMEYTFLSVSLVADCDDLVQLFTRSRENIVRCALPRMRLCISRTPVE